MKPCLLTLTVSDLTKTLLWFYFSSLKILMLKFEHLAADWSLLSDPKFDWSDTSMRRNPVLGWIIVFCCWLAIKPATSRTPSDSARRPPAEYFKLHLAEEEEAEPAMAASRLRCSCMWRQEQRVFI